MAAQRIIAVAPPEGLQRQNRADAPVRCGLLRRCSSPHRAGGIINPRPVAARLNRRGACASPAARDRAGSDDRSAPCPSGLAARTGWRRAGDQQRAYAASRQCSDADASAMLDRPSAHPFFLRISGQPKHARESPPHLKIQAKNRRPCSMIPCPGLANLLARSRCFFSPAVSGITCCTRVLPSLCRCNYRSTSARRSRR